MFMSEKEDEKNSQSKTDALIEEAVRAVEQEQEGEAAQASSEESAQGGEGEESSSQSSQENVHKEAYLRLAADFDNFRRRAMKEKQEAERIGKEKVFRKFLDFLDDFDRGLAQANEDDSSLAHGMRMVLSQAESWLDSEGLKRIPTIGEKFDPSVHDAVAQREDSEHEPGTVIEELKRGYQWSDRLLRPASVVVAKAPEERNADATDAEGVET